VIALDSSVIVAIAQGESDGRAFVLQIEDKGAAAISAANFVEASIVLEGRHGAAGRMMFESTITQLAGVRLSVVALDRGMAELARDGFRRYGKGLHPAGLNFGDCFAYALAKTLDAPLLYKGGDFDKTDVKRA
jgi:ribonuclease VapC